MPLYMDIHHNVEGITAEAMAAEHQKDLEHQGKHGVKFVKYWFDAEKKAIFCLSHAPNAEAAKAVHAAAGHPADDIFHVTEGE